MRAGSGLRLAHTAVLVAVCVAVSGTGHALASGTSLPPVAYGVAVPPVCLLGWRLTRKERSAGVVVSVGAAVQALLHLLFGAVPHGAGSGGAHHATGHTAPYGTAGQLPLPAPGSASGPLSGPPPDSASAMTSALSAVSSPSSVSEFASASASGLTSGWTAAFTSVPTAGMTAAHLAAGAVCGWWLWHGQRALTRIALALHLFLRGRLRLARAALCCAYAVLPPEGVRPPRPRPQRVRLPESLLLLRAVTRRGPPLLPS
ncbi:hypothetical protein ACIQ9E_10390 [Streptomyces sp. NPDC094448]|uniref:hypothetical protein n=1 Tax=Streptomyces sp. NPDC094448 TaxID=3366063 RepID=UPI0037FEDDBF